ncbi:TlpA disulfide reductase family protein [Mucilaginibacter arboris]|uniref:Redoxin domain-containing protein n=1 Tax=Mucilaginibacter arboris TaxID=2682090 RepID=A0A7K1SXK0_9SPHI|nr:TlpA disulfide reductase family protein [Mucilaginibacter arboris]MVN21967.1 redoxin domain-containing protein [Mucilaginibacter arboris]
MKKLMVPALFAVAALTSCKDKNTFKIEGKIEHPAQQKVYLLEADSTNVRVIDSTQLSEQNEFVFKKSAPFANLYKIKNGDQEFDLIAENGNGISFKTDLADPAHNYTTSGSEDSEKIREYNRISNIYSAKNSKLANEYQEAAAAKGANQDSVLKKYLPQFEQNMASLSNEILKFVNENKNSLASFYAAMSLDQMKYEKELVAYADELKGKFPGNQAVMQFEKHMELVKPVSVGHQAPDFSIPGIDGKPVKLADYKGKYVMLDFWASWCAPCRKENPNVVKLYQQYHPKGLNIVGISLDEDKNAWQKAVNDDHLTWTHGGELKNFNGPTVASYQVQAIPSNFILDPSGKIIAKNITGNDLAVFFAKIFGR